MHNHGERNERKGMDRSKNSLQFLRESFNKKKGQSPGPAPAPGHIQGSAVSFILLLAQTLTQATRVRVKINTVKFNQSHVYSSYLDEDESVSDPLM
jgi:hypothetical protein